MTIGVVVGRFQVPALHEGHVALLSAVAQRCQRLVILVGVAPAPANANDPLPFFARADAIRSVFPSAEVVPLLDLPTDEAWSSYIDHVVEGLRANGDQVIVFGGRDSCLPHYHGRWQTEELGLSVHLSGTEIRRATELGASYEFRQGMVYAAAQRFPTSFQTVDIAILHGGRLLTGRKATETHHRFPGGFVDPQDASLEAAAMRELHEECGPIEVSRLVYAGSVRIDDWRYRGSVDKIMTSLFVGSLVFGAPRAGDDLATLCWIPLESLHEIHPVHQPLVALLHRHLEDGHVR